MNAYSTEIWAAVIGGTIFLVVGFSLFARWCGYSPAVGRNKLEALNVGMSAPDVIALLGRPRQKQPGEKGEEFWIYGAQWKRHVLVVEFNGSGTLREFVHGVPHPRRGKKTMAG
jgi:hypothetical protein